MPLFWGVPAQEKRIIFCCLKTMAEYFLDPAPNVTGTNALCISGFACQGRRRGQATLGKGTNMFGQSKPKTAEVIHYWHELVPNFQTSPQDFYAAVEKSLQERKVPGLDSERVDFAEGGLLSAKREYLRLTRERLVFDICAAPFGTSFFFSCRFAELPLVIDWGGRWLQRCSSSRSRICCSPIGGAGYLP